MKQFSFLTFLKKSRLRTVEGAVLQVPRELTNSQRDWMLLLGIFFVFVVLLGGVSVYLFLRVNSGELLVTGATASAGEGSFLNRSVLRTTLEAYRERERRFTELLEGDTAPLVAVPQAD